VLQKEYYCLMITKGNVSDKQTISTRDSQIGLKPMHISSE